MVTTGGEGVGQLNVREDLVAYLCYYEGSFYYHHLPDPKSEIYTSVRMNKASICLFHLRSISAQSLCA